MGRRIALIAAAIAAFVLSLIVWLPARVLAPFLPPSVAVGTLQGSIWSGSTDYLAVNGTPLGAFKWRLHPLGLLRGRADLDVGLESPTSRGQGRVAVGFSGALDAHDLKLQAPLSAFPAELVPPRWQGEANLDLRHLTFNGKQITQALGTLQVHNLRAPPPDNTSIGSYRLTFDEQSRQGERWVGRVQDIDGPMQVSGTLSFGQGREYLLEGKVASRPGASDALSKTLLYLGEPDAQGLRPFSIAGTY